MNLRLLVGMLGMVLVVSGCVQTHQVKDQNIKTGFLVNSYPLLKPGKEGEEAKLVYINPKAKWNKYDKIMLDAVSVWLGKDSEAHDTGVIPPDDVRDLANSFYKKLVEHLSKDYTIVPASGPDVMRLSVALTDIEHGMPVLDSLSTVIFSPILALDQDKTVARATHLFVGHANVEVRLVDSISGELLAAGIDQRAGGKKLGKGTGFWRDVENVFDYWSAKIRWRLCQQRNGKGCQNPDA
jgi:hypothetical protein